MAAAATWRACRPSRSTRPRRAGPPRSPRSAHPLRAAPPPPRPPAPGGPPPPGGPAPHDPPAHPPLCEPPRRHLARRPGTDHDHVEAPHRRDYNEGATQPLGTTGFDVVDSWGRLRVEVPEASLN